MKKLNIIIFGSCLMLAVFVMANLGQSDAAERNPAYAIGKECQVQFRRDALGAAASLPVPPTTGSINGAEVSVRGKIKSVTGEWFIIERDGREVWIPKPVILLVEVF